MEKAALPIHFEDRSGKEFERLAFAYILNIKTWDDIRWLGETGDDGGRDIWGESIGETFCYQCANYRRVVLKKIADDIDKLVKWNTIPDNFIVVCGGPISAELRSKVESYAKAAGIKRVGTWSSAEFEEKLRKDTIELVKRFVQGEEFPDSPAELLEYVRSFSIKDDKDIIALLVENFDRPAFTTRFRDESSIPDFAKAIKGVIEVLNTGVHRLNDGTVIRTIPSRHRITDYDLKKKFTILTANVIELRDAFARLIKSKDISPCGCGQVDCPTYILSDRACAEMDELREGILEMVRDIEPNMQIRVRS